ncbi:MAG: hypothetical protein M1355_03075 [Patescibacteria group bacterium]|nr:hypothetical protein [Patescibacteria group bacterium]
MSKNAQQVQDANNKSVQALQKQIDELKKIQTQVATPNTSTTTKENIPSYANDWYKYIDSEYDFSFRYPKTGGGDLLGGTKACKNPLIPVKRTDYTAYGNFFGITVVNNQNNLTLDEYIAKKELDKYMTFKKPNYGSAKEAYIVDKNRSGIGIGGDQYLVALYRDKNNIYEMHSFQNPGSLEDCDGSIPAGMSILETFNFTN